jgi:hypothetical protein
VEFGQKLELFGAFMSARKKKKNSHEEPFLVWSLGTGLLHSVFAFRFITCAFLSVVFRNPGRSGSLWEEIVVLV